MQAIVSPAMGLRAARSRGRFMSRRTVVADRTVRRWVAGTVDMPPGLYVDLLRLTQERAAVLDALAPRLRKAGS